MTSDSNDWRTPPAAVRGALAMALAAAALGAAPPLYAQDEIEPAEAIRVVERKSPYTGRVERLTVAELLPAEVLRIQIALAEAGHDPGVRNGVLDAATREALTAFQVEEGLLICGCPTYQTIVALRIDPVVVAARPARGERSRRVLIVGPGHHHHGHHVHHGHRHGRAGVVVGGTSGVFVGHAPARGAGELRDHPRSRIRDRRPSPRGPRPAPPQRPGRRIRSGGDP
ncbi:MAG: peptidoglycan-binding domain-containing protein [Gemmatimonadota bacterium]|nr:peptidoglycan-binding domain-containing protein [Gemmatimonadota bacterium]